MSAEKTQVSIRLPAELLGEVDRVAAALERDRTWVMLHAFKRYLDDEGAEILSEAEGIEALDRGEGVALKALLDQADSLLKAGRARPAKKSA